MKDLALGAYLTIHDNLSRIRRKFSNFVVHAKYLVLSKIVIRPFNCTKNGWEDVALVLGSRVLGNVKCKALDMEVT